MSAAAKPPAGTALRVRIHERIATVDPAEWDEILSPEDLQVSHRFVRICEESEIAEARYRHLLVERAGRVVAVASLCRIVVSLDLLSTGFTREAIRAVRRVRPRFLHLPVVLCGLPVSFGASCARIRAGEDPVPVVQALASEAEAFAAEVGARLVCFKEFTSDEAVAFGSLARRGYVRAPSLPFCALPVAWGSFDGYLRDLRSGYRRQVRASLRSARDAGLSLRSVRGFGSECPRIFALYEQVMDRAEFQLERLNLRFFERLDADLGDDSEAVLVEQGGRLVAAAVLLHTPQALTFLLAGMDYRRCRSNGAYPSLVTDLVGRAIARRAGRLDLGQTSYALKSRLGAVPVPRWIFLTHRSTFGRLLLRQASPALFPVAKVRRRRVFGRPSDTEAGPLQGSGSAAEPPRSQGWSDLRGRAAVALFGLPAVTGLVLLPASWPWAMAVALAGAVAARECIGLLARRRTRALEWSATAAALATTLAIYACGPSRWRWLGPPVILVMALVGAALYAARRPSRARAVGAVALSALLCGALPAHLALLRWRSGSAWVVLALGIAWGGAMAGFFAGRALGGPRLAPRVSPAKTLAGALAGFAAAGVAGLLFVAMRAGQVGGPGFWSVVAIGASLSQAGDLGESWLKRRAGAKDSGRLLAEQGGVLDSLDGFVLLAPWLFFAR